MYTQYTLDSLAIQIGDILDDTGEVYWTRPEKYYAVWEAMRVFGAYTSYWRQRGTFNIAPIGPTVSPFNDLSVLFPQYRPRKWTLNQLTQEIQYHLLENPSGISGVGMSGQVSISSILSAIQRARNRFVIDAHLPFNVIPILTPDSQGIAPLDESTVYMHRASWQSQLNGQWQNLFREDAWAVDHNNPVWTLQPGFPLVCSESELSPLSLQLSPAPAYPGSVETICVKSLLMDLTDPAATFAIPDEWVHAIKYAAIYELLLSQDQLNDAMRAEYCNRRYHQSVDLARTARSVLRTLVNNVPCALDSLFALDAGMPYWRNQTGPPQSAGAMYDLVVFGPSPDQTYGATVDMATAAPLPQPGNGSDAFIQIGPEDIPHLIDYVLNYLSFKCGGNEFKDTFSNYDNYMDAVAVRGRINKAKIRYMQPLFGQPDKEEAERPDMMPVAPGRSS